MNLPPRSMNDSLEDIMDPKLKTGVLDRCIC